MKTVVKNLVLVSQVEVQDISTKKFYGVALNTKNKSFIVLSVNDYYYVSTFSLERIGHTDETSDWLPTLILYLLDTNCKVYEFDTFLEMAQWGAS